MLGGVEKDDKFWIPKTWARRIIFKVKKISHSIFHLNASQRTLHKWEKSAVLAVMLSFQLHMAEQKLKIVKRNFKKKY